MLGAQDIGTVLTHSRDGGARSPSLSPCDKEGTTRGRGQTCCASKPGTWRCRRKPATGARPHRLIRKTEEKGGKGWLDKQDPQGFQQRQHSVRTRVRTRACRLPVASPEPFSFGTWERGSSTPLLHPCLPVDIHVSSSVSPREGCYSLCLVLLATLPFLPLP